MPGNRHDYDEWAELTGDKSWSYGEMLKYLKKLEKFDVTAADIDSKLHNFDGPLRITNAPHRTALGEAFVKAGEELGLPSRIDYNGENQTGFAYLQTNQINGERLTTNRAYLHPVRNRKNLFVSMYSHVNKVLIDPKTKTAYGVEFTKEGKTIKVLAEKEVILSAGGIGSPKLLMLSGIGPAKQLQSLNIKVLRDAPVGENLMDHVVYGGLTFLTNETESLILQKAVDPRDPLVIEYLNERKGPVTLPSGIEGIAFANVDDLNSRSDTPNIELFFACVTLASDRLVHRPFGITEENFETSWGDVLFQHGYFIWPVLIRPKSRGQVLLRSADPADLPKIIPNYFSDPDDVRVAVKGIRMALEVARTKSMQQYESRLHSKIPGCENHEPDSDAYWECALRTYSMTIWHFSGTCKMGRENDTTAIVDHRLRVSLHAIYSFMILCTLPRK